MDQSTFGWYSEVDEDDDIENLNESLKETPRFPIYSEGENMKNRDLEVCMKFPNISVFREALRDWLVRNGYELHFLKNERARITGKCKAEGCNWRIHASVVQGGPLFQVIK